MAVRIGSQAADRLSGTSAADVIYGYDPNAGTPPTMAANAIASGLVNPLYLTSAPGNSNHLFILEKRGQVKVYDAGTGQVLATPFLTVNVATDGEQGLLGLAFARILRRAGDSTSISARRTATWRSANTRHWPTIPWSPIRPA